MTSPSINRQRQSPAPSRWLLGSLIVHGGFLVLILVLLGGKDARTKASQTNASSVTSSARLEELSEKVRELHERHLMETVSSLEETLEAMETLEQERVEQLRQAYPEQTASASDNVMTAHDQALAAQERALRGIDVAVSASEARNTIELAEARTAAIEEQTAAEEALSQMATALSLAGRPTDALDEIVDLQVNASQALAAAHAKDRDAEAAQAEIDRRSQQNSHALEMVTRQVTEVRAIEAEITKRLQEREEALAAIEQAKETSEAETTKIAEAEVGKQLVSDAYKQARKNVADAQNRLRVAQASKDRVEIDAAQQAVKESRSQEMIRLKEQQRSVQESQQQKQKANVARHSIKMAEHRLTTIEHQLETLEQRKARSGDQLQSVQNRADVSDGDMTLQRTRMEESRTEAKSLLAEARTAQELALSKSRLLDPVTDAATGELSQTPTNVQEAFQRARDLERKIAHRFKDFRSADLALVQAMEPSDARKLVSVPLPQRPAIDEAALDQTARTQAAMRNQIETLSKAEQQATTMAEFAQALLERAQGLELEGLQITLAERQADAAEERSQSAEDDGGAVSDMTSLMARRSDQKNQSAQATRRASDSAGNNADPEYTVVDQKVLSVPPSPKQLASATPARRFGTGAGAAKSGWTFVDSWYILGPFDNAQRANIHKQFPPESMVDLDATYRTRAAIEPIGWRFYQATSPKIEPRHLQGEYVIYYAWTQLHFDSPTDVWIAVGSDDRSDLWINDVRVWSSSDVLKMWKVDEGMRRVRFEAGYNKVLYRIENGNGPWAFSLCLNLDSQTKPASQ
ncbi:hypothetical protein [Rhodopirellula sp. SWK7]|uniref:hypothetical protein n=1 Tax=Rhodopirellula sp. SWK7 TaxID=595460 RepID=UPI0002BF05D7|nr:hypothetical protein [Rhodopirellula sp. SWK7]EMI44061.1 hypothetical protein RRSWK_03386 [Rhodopirellula sp. SWK7]